MQKRLQALCACCRLLIHHHGHSHRKFTEGSQSWASEFTKDDPIVGVPAMAPSRYGHGRCVTASPVRGASAPGLGLSCDCHGWARAAGTPQRVASTITLNRAAGLRRSITTTHESTLIHDCGLLASRDTGGPRHSGGRLSRAAPGSGVRDYSVLCTVQRTVQVYVSSCDRFQIAYMWSGAVW